jgi:hypothetical protein
MKLFLDKNHRNVSIVSVILMSLGFMKFTGWGSFDPKVLGFWLAIINAILVQLFINYMFYKFWTPDSKKNGASRE